MRIGLQNIHANFSKIFYTIRENNKLIIKEDNGFFPYFYEPDKYGTALSYDGIKLSKVSCRHPGEVKQKRTPYSYEADVLYTKRYILDKVDEIVKSQTRFCLFDIETKSSKLPNPKEDKCAPDPITFIRVYDSLTQERKTFDYRKYPTEFDMLEDFCTWIKEKEFDVLSAWNIDGFDYPYLYYRIPGFPERISPIGQKRIGEDDVFYPALISIVDLLSLDYKYTLGKRESYAADEVALEEFGEESDKEYKFAQEDDKVLAKNINDVERMIKLVEKYKYFDHFDAIRCSTMCLWEDIPPKRINYQWQSNNSKPIDMLFLKEAKKLGLVMPSKNPDAEAEEYDGAFREIYTKGLIHEPIGVYDLGSAYPVMLMDFCLDPSNLSETSSEDAIKIDVLGRETGNIIGTYYYKQNEKAIIPVVAKKLLTAKNELKEKMKQMDVDSAEYHNAEIQYATQKALVNSLYGVMGQRFFRLFNRKVAETDTFLVRDLLHYIKTEIEKQGHKVIYIDTDSVMIQSEKNLTDVLNRLVLIWGMDKYEKKVSVKFDYQGHFEGLFLLAMCRYIGNLRTPKGLKLELKGIQMKRKDASAFTKAFQEKIFNALLSGQNADEVENLILSEIERLRNASPLELGSPCKFNKSRENYKKQEIFFRAYDNTRKFLPDFYKDVGSRFFWIHTRDEYEVLAFDKECYDHIKYLNYPLLIEKHILNVLVPIYSGMGWGERLLQITDKLNIVIGSQHRNELIEGLPNAEELKEYYSANATKKRKAPPKEEKPKKSKKVLTKDN